MLLPWRGCCLAAGEFITRHHFFDFTFPADITLGGWLGGALQWHFAMMWVLTANGVIYLTLNIFSGRFCRIFFPLSFRQLAKELRLASRGKLQHHDLRHYNTIQKVAYLLVILNGVGLIVSGLVYGNQCNFHCCANYLAVTRLHAISTFICMTVLVLFAVVHLVMVLLVPRTLLAMLRGR